jgi:hypothetical protein
VLTRRCGGVCSGRGWRMRFDALKRSSSSSSCVDASMWWCMWCTTAFNLASFAENLEWEMFDIRLYLCIIVLAVEDRKPNKKKEAKYLDLLNRLLNRIIQFRFHFVPSHPYFAWS